jgi:hypothetical protein
MNDPKLPPLPGMLTAAGTTNGAGDAVPKNAPRWLLVSLAVLSLLLASGLALWMINAPANAEPAAARFWLCFAVSLYLTVFFFIILWRQQDLSMDTGLPTWLSWLSNQKVKITGPIVLFVVLMVFLYSFSPNRETFMAPYRVDAPPSGLLFDPAGTKVEYKGPNPDGFSYRLISGTGDDHDALKEMLIRFPSGEQAITLEITHPTYKPNFTVTLNRKDQAINLTAMEKIPPPPPAPLPLEPLPGMPPEPQTQAFIFGGEALVVAQKTLDGAKDQSLLRLSRSGQRTSALYLKVSREGMRIVEIDVLYCEGRNPKPQQLREAPFRPTETDDFNGLVRIVSRN